MSMMEELPAVPEGVDLDALYAPPADRIQKAVLDRLVDVHEDYLRVATFFCLATASGNSLDASPRGGPLGFVRVLDPHIVAFADWPANNRIESMRNLAQDELVGMLFLFSGLDVFLRINGVARVSAWPDLLSTLTESGTTPKTATVVRLNEVLFHCGKAGNRARPGGGRGKSRRSRQRPDAQPDDGQADGHFAGRGRLARHALYARRPERPVLADGGTMKKL